MLLLSDESAASCLLTLWKLGDFFYFCEVDGSRGDVLDLPNIFNVSTCY